jgi:hypothetical protein
MSGSKAKFLWLSFPGSRAAPTCRNFAAGAAGKGSAHLDWKPTSDVPASVCMAPVALRTPYLHRHSSSWFVPPTPRPRDHAFHRPSPADDPASRRGGAGRLSTLPCLPRGPGLRRLHLVEELPARADHRPARRTAQRWALHQGRRRRAAGGVELPLLWPHALGKSVRSSGGPLARETGGESAPRNPRPENTVTPVSRAFLATTRGPGAIASHHGMAVAPEAPPALCRATYGSLASPVRVAHVIQNAELIFYG